MRINLLGSFEVLRDGQVVTPSAPKLRRVLALLAINANKVVRTDQLIEELWDDRPPHSATTTLQTYVYQLRKLHHLAADGAERTPALRTSANGYLLSLSADALDAAEFSRLAEAGRAELELGDLESAAATLRAALRLWRGAMLADVGVGPVLQTATVWFEELRKSVLEQRIDVDIRLGRHHELVGELAGVVAEHPTHEGFQGKLMLALYRCGRRSEALRAYQRARDALADELGLEPSPELQRLHQALLAADTSLDAPPPSGESTRVGCTTVCPSQLPPDIPHFVGRADQLRTANDLICARNRDAPPVVVVVGPPGSGKSAFCVHLARHARTRFPDGQFYAELVAADGTPVAPAAVLAGFLRAIGLSGTRMPESVAERSRLFRSWTADRRVLVVLDDAVDAGQIAPLLPSGADCATLVAGRRRLAHPTITATVSLRPFTADDATRLLTQVLGGQRVEADQDAAGELVELCDGLPLALRAAASQLELRPHWPVSRQVHQLRGPDRETEVCASLWRTYRLLPAPVQTAFRVVATLDRPVSAPLAATALGTDELSAESLLEDLAQVHLVEVDTPVDNASSTGFRYRVLRPVRRAARLIAETGDQRPVLGESPVDCPEQTVRIG